MTARNTHLIFYWPRIYSNLLFVPSKDVFCNRPFGDPRRVFWGCGYRDDDNPTVSLCISHDA